MTAGAMRLPWPPSANRYWRHPTRGPLAGRHLLSAEGREYRETVRALARAFRWEAFVGPVWLYVEAFPPDRRRRDLDNLLKALQDALAFAGIIADDADIGALFVVRREVTKGGACYVRLGFVS